MSLHLNSSAAILAALTGLFRLVEIALGERNAALLKQKGGREYAAWQRWPIFIVYAAWLITLTLRVPVAATPHPSMLGLFALLEVFRWWSIFHLKEFWTTRIIVVPLAWRVRKGPYRFFRHPIYIALLGEVLALSLAFDAWAIGCLFSGLTLWWLYLRIREENRVIRQML